MGELEALASTFIKHQESARSELDFKKHLKKVKDLQELRKLADKYTPHIEVSIPLNERILELNPSDVEAIVALGFLFWLDGEDDKAWQQIKQARSLNAEHVGALTLEAALTTDRNAQVMLYESVLERDPNNRVAQENLKEVGTP
ncbi:hypothetical protein HYR99_40400 [Candidatus Poribacteria bacterium]|nr:hypothetical protein [Candidatus Poribacteria bacterium]